MGSKTKLKEIYEAEVQYGAFYTGGSVAWSPDGSRMYCQNGSRINAVAVDSVSIVTSFGSESDDENSDVVYRFALNADGSTLISAHKSGLLRLWNTETGTLKKMWKSLHQGPVATLAFNGSGDDIASGGSDSLIRLWDAELQVCRGTVRGCEGVVTLLVFHPGGEFVLGSGSDAKINCWTTKDRRLVRQFASHFSTVTSVAFEGTFMVSSGRDKVVILWNFEEGTQIRTIPVYEAVEEVLFLPTGMFGESLCVATAGEEGLIKAWDVQGSRLLYKQEESFVSKASEEGGLAVTYMMMNRERGQLAVVSVDHNIIIHDLTKRFECVKQLVGFSDEILDLTLFNKNKYLAMATNSVDLKLYDTENMSCRLLRGHTDIVLAIAAHANILISSSKDCSVRVWRVEEAKITLLGTGTRHTSAVGAVDLSTSQDFFASASQDKCIKLWKIPSEPVETLMCLGTQLAHDKDINSIAIAPNNKLMATGSQDKTAKLWDASDLSLVGVLRGHKRGIWSVKFSPTDQILLTTAADCTIRLWSLTDLSSLKSFEGHESSVLRAEFISDGMQLLSTGGDGLVKVWNVKTSECTQTLDKHEARIWALSVSSYDESIFYSGGADSQLIKWRDVTAERRDAEIKESQAIALQDQQLSNLLKQRKMLKALRLALKLDRPFTTLKIVNAIIRDQEESALHLEATILELNDDLKESLLRHASNWNTNSRNTAPAQLVINILMPDILAKKLHVTGLGKFLEETLPYTERHYKRMTEYLKDINYIEYTLKCIRPHTQNVEERSGVKMEEDSE